MKNEPTKSRTARSILVEWASKQDGWVRALVAGVVANRAPIGTEQIESLYEQFLREKGLREGDPGSVPSLESGTDSENGQTTLVLTELVHVANVNALAEGQALAFNPRMTLVFGENAAGKTGFVRILKKAASVRGAEDVLPNVEKPGPRGRPDARIRFRDGETDKDLEWKGEGGVAPLTRIDVFDARAVEVHLTDELAYSYTPSDLALFRYVHDGVEKIRLKLAADQEAATPRGNPFAPRIDRKVSFFPKVESLGAATDLTEIRSVANVSAEEEEGLQPLREKVAALSGGGTNARLQLAREERSLLEKGRLIAETVAAFDSDEYARALAGVRSAREEHARATREALINEPIPNVLGESWRRFVEAGEAYVLDVGLAEYPREGNHCIYCRQPLGPVALDLLRKYRDYCNNALRSRVDDLAKRLGGFTKAVRDLDVGGLQRLLEARIQAGSGSVAFEQLAALLVRVAELQEAVVATRPTDAKSLAEQATQLASELTLEVVRIDDAIAEMVKESKERKAILEAEQIKLRELEGRLVLRSLLPDLTAFVDKAKWANRATSFLSRFRSLKVTLTDASKQAGEGLLNQDFARLFAEECAQLRAPTVLLDFPGRQGQPARRKSLPSEHRIEAVLSEGEQNVLALADFLAEASLRKPRAPIIFDDPVTSLDYKRMDYVVRRLVTLSETHQVVVFTHNILFAWGLLARFETDPDACAFYDVAESNGKRGIVSKGQHPRTDTFANLRSRINTCIQEAGKTQGAMQRSLVEQGYDMLRSACEVVVEADLLQGVTQRYQPNVMMTKLPRIRADLMKATTDVVLPLYDRACRITQAHAQPIETLNVRPRLDELKEDWARLQTARDDLKR